MVVVKIEIWPFGEESKASEIGRMTIVNDGTGTPSLGNYRVRLRHAKAFAKTRSGSWRKGAFGRHRRTLSPYHLVERALKACGIEEESK